MLLAWPLLPLIGIGSCCGCHMIEATWAIIIIASRSNKASVVIEMYQLTRPGCALRGGPFAWHADARLLVQVLHYKYKEAKDSLLAWSCLDTADLLPRCR